ncbi:hypothetical protein TrST_g3581 [Triparma strigata]|uniref:AB hydrolase-1 domain-containing protein n=1 Tax=Triparma strigata TaxID=1606541 RepID=A0A9W7EML9_9STRA|nr:hypothetical protein TrST_g3581 [Triparma strigata]
MSAFAFQSSRVPLHSAFYPPILPSVPPLAPLLAPPNLLLCYIHGLDSSSTTWGPFLSVDAESAESAPFHRSFPSYAVDLRGHGQSPLADPSQFTPDAVVEDLTGFLSDVVSRPPFDPTSAIPPKVVVVGHSMGGRVAMLLAAKLAGALGSSLPFELTKVVIEDMDVKVRNKPPFAVTWEPPGGDFDRAFMSCDDCVSALIKSGYDEKRVKDWVVDGRIRNTQEEKWWSDVNPQTRALCYERILGSECGADAMEAIRAEEWQENVTLVVAGGTGPRGTVCDKESLEKMKRRLRGCDYFTVENAGHSIHKTHKDAFSSIIDGICRQVAE